MSFGDSARVLPRLFSFGKTQRFVNFFENNKAKPNYSSVNASWIFPNGDKIRYAGLSSTWNKI